MRCAAIIATLAWGILCGCSSPHTVQPGNGRDTTVNTGTETETLSTDTDSGVDPSADPLCAATGGTWKPTSCGGDWPCGMPPFCQALPGDDLPKIPGCDCGGGKMFDNDSGCALSPDCTALDCGNVGGLPTAWGLSTDTRIAPVCQTRSSMGWAVVDEVCTEILGCPLELPNFPMFPSRDACHLGCDTLQKLCLQSSGVWMLEPACDHHTCGVADMTSCSSTERLTVCNCGPLNNWTDSVGCEEDTDCPPIPPAAVCPTYDFDVYYTPTDGCTLVPGLGYGTRDGESCATIIGCPDDFDPFTGFVSPANYFDSYLECVEACAGCTDDTDCDDENHEFCQFPQETNCGEWGLGVCVETAEFCTQIYDPLCGCDGNYISNECAIDFGRSLAHDGECFTIPIP